MLKNPLTIVTKGDRSKPLIFKMSVNKLVWVSSAVTM